MQRGLCSGDNKGYGAGILRIESLTRGLLYEGAWGKVRGARMFWSRGAFGIGGYGRHDCCVPSLALHDPFERFSCVFDVFTSPIRRVRSRCPCLQSTCAGPRRPNLPPPLPPSLPSTYPPHSHIHNIQATAANPLAST